MGHISAAANTRLRIALAAKLRVIDLEEIGWIQDY